MEKTLTIKLVKSPIATPKNQKDTLKALGLTKINKT
ncbi:MAG TPA: uL30 family ribosomal protein, partial [Bacilli bacterium]|nr:uL30 family ribosomal protein [Bacilli bacterium]